MAAMRTEEYIETIYDIVVKKGYAKVKDVSKLLGVGFSAVSEMLEKLSKDGYINYEKYGGITITEKGEKVALALLKKHEALRDFFILLGVDKKTANADACKIEHVVERETMDRLTKFVAFIQLHKGTGWLKRFRDYYESS